MFKMKYTELTIHSLSCSLMHWQPLNYFDNEEMLKTKWFSGKLWRIPIHASSFIFLHIVR